MTKDNETLTNEDINALVQFDTFLYARSKFDPRWKKVQREVQAFVDKELTRNVRS